jgi:hypothetical protein
VADYAGRLEAANLDGYVSRIRALLDSQSEEYLAEVDAEDDGVLERLQLVLDHVLVVSATAVPALVPRKWIDDLVQDLGALESAVQGVCELTSITVAAANALTSTVEAVAVELMTWPLTGGGDWRDSVTQAASTYRRSLGQQLLAFNAELDATRTDLEAVRATVEAAGTNFAEITTEKTAALDQSLAALTQRLSSLEAKQETVASQIDRSVERAADATIATFQQQFATAQENRSVEYKASFDEQQASADESLEALAAKVDEAGVLVTAFAAAGTANAFSEEARDQAEAANRWRFVAIALALSNATRSRPQGQRPTCHQSRTRTT